MENYSVLMSVYYKENPEYLKQSILSMIHQTIPTNDFVIVCDGPLTDPLNQVLKDFCSLYPNIIHIIRRPQNCGLGESLNAGLLECKNEFVARMDSDDISLPNRCQMQLQVFYDNPDIDIVGGIINEFMDDPNKIVGSRVIPSKSEDIFKFSKTRNPFNHMSVMFKKHTVLKAGNYMRFQFLEDYYLWIRMFNIGAQPYNLNQTLVLVRIGNGMYDRRSGWNYFKSQFKLFRFMKETHYISRMDFIASCAGRCCMSIMPNFMRTIAYQKFLHKQRELS